MVRQRHHSAVDLSTAFTIAVLAALLGTAGLDAYAFSTFIGSAGGGGSHSPRAAVVHLDRANAHEAASVKNKHSR